MSKATSIQALTWAVMDGWAWTSASAWRDTQGLSSGVCLAGHQKPRRNLGVVELRLERRGGCQCRGHLRVVDYVVHHHQPAHRVHDARLGADGPARPSVSGGGEERLARYWDTDGRRGAERESDGARRRSGRVAAPAVDVLKRRGARERRKRRGAKLSNKVRGRRRRRRQSTGTRLGRSARRQPAGAGNKERAGNAAATRGGSGGLAVACGRGGGAVDKGAKEAGREQGEGGAWKRPPRAVAAPSRRHVVSSCAALHETRPARKTATAP